MQAALLHLPPVVPIPLPSPHPSAAPRQRDIANLSKPRALLCSSLHTCASTSHHCHPTWKAVQHSLLLTHHKARTLPALLSWLSQCNPAPCSLPTACKASYQHSQTTKQFVFTTVIAHGDENLNRMPAFLDTNVSRDFCSAVFQQGFLMPCIC